MTHMHEELRAGAKVLDIIDRRREQTGDPALGAAIERVIIDRCLADLEHEMAEPVPVLVRLRKAPPPRRRFEQ